MPSLLQLWLSALCVRIISALITGTFFSPDEYWQCGEVAHQLVFGYGSLTWEWTEALRPALPVAPFIFLYTLLRFLRLDSALLLAKMPSILQAVFASFGDVAMHHTAQRIAGPAVARWTLALHLTSHFLMYCITRPFSNSLETVLVQLAFSQWPWPCTAHARPALALLFAALSVAVRPTAALIWVPIGIHLLLTSPSPFTLILRLVFPILSAVAILSAVTDRWLYKRWVCVACAFIRFNATPNMAARYGTQPWHWYFTGAAPMLLGPMLALLPYGASLAPSNLPSMSMLFVTTILSFNAHKEFRFLLPVLPLALLLAAIASVQLIVTYRSVRPLLIALMGVSVVAGLYLCTIHQRGPISLMQHLSHDESLDSLMLLMPCHSTPLYSHLHRNVSIKTLDCSPPLWAPPTALTLDEADVFYDNPLVFLTQNYAHHNTTLPSHVAFFSVLLPSIDSWLNASGYTLVFSPLNRVGVELLTERRARGFSTLNSSSTVAKAPRFSFSSGLCHGSVDNSARTPT